MAILILGLIVFIGVHSIRLVSPSWRDAQLARFGEHGWKGIYSVASLVGFVLIVWGYGLARHTPIVLWTPPFGIRHLTALLVLIAFVLNAIAFEVRNGAVIEFDGHVDDQDALRTLECFEPTRRRTEVRRDAIDLTQVVPPGAEIVGVQIRGNRLCRRGGLQLRGHGHSNGH